MKHRILLHTNPTHIRTGLAQNASTLLQYLWKTGKYEIAHYCSQVSVADPNLALTPWKSYGCLPTDPNLINELNRDPGKARSVSYGSWNIDNVIKDWRPTIYIGSDDAWSFEKSSYIDKPWWKQINSILHITIDSLPVLELAFEQAEHTKHYLTWAKFARKAMHKMGPKFAHVGQIYGAMDTTQFEPIPVEKRNELRQRFGIGQNTVVLNYVFRNQLRKSANLILEAFRDFKRENPTADVKLHFHTSVAEKAHGWDFPKMMSYYGINPQDVLFTYVCKKCGTWHVSPFVGEDVNCPYCKGEKSMATVNIVHGVPPDEMKYVYGIADAAFSVANSGGQELTACQSMLCELPLACTSYSSGEDFCLCPEVFPLSWHPYHEAGTNFIKAATEVSDIKKFIHKVWKMPSKDLKNWGQRSRDWAVKTFSIETIGAQWEALFDSLPEIDWNKVDLTPQIKNDQYPFPEIEDPDQFVTALYANILKMNEGPNGDGRKHWLQKIKEGMDRRQIHAYFISVAQQENAKNGAGAKDFGEMLDKTGKRRILYIMKESGGDCLISTQLFEALHAKYPNHDLYVACDPKFKSIFDGNPFVFKVLDFQGFMENELLMIGTNRPDSERYFHVFLHPGILTQRQLFYLSA